MSRLSRLPDNVYLKNGSRYFYKGHCSHVFNELRQRVNVDYDSDDYEVIIPPCITEQGRYTAKIVGDLNNPCQNLALILTEVGGEHTGFRHRFQLYDYRVSIPIHFKSTDPRVGNAVQDWHIRGGGFFTYVKTRPYATWKFQTGNPSVLWIGYDKIPAQ